VYLISGTNFIDVDGRQFLVHDVNLSYFMAAEKCKTLQANIVSFTNPVQYILLKKNITLNGNYWVGGNTIICF
jgi:hypothetical protein